MCSTSQIPSLIKVLNYTLLNTKFLFLFMLTKAHDPTRRSGTLSFRLILLIVNNSKEKFQSEISKNNIYFVQRKASRNQWISECIKTNDAGNSHLHDSYNTCEDPAYFWRGFLWICRTICPASCPVIRIFLLEQKQTWRATGLLVSIRVRTHETTPGLAAL